MKHLFSFAIIFFISIATLAQSYLGRVSKQVNFREGPGVEYPVIKALKKETHVFIISTDSENDFYNVIDIDSNKEGYVHKSYITIEKELPKNTEGVFNPKGSIDSYNSEIEIYNNTSKKLTLRLNKEVYTFLPKEKKMISLVPGSYDYIASAPAVIPDYGSETLKNNFSYTWEFYIVSTYK